MDPLLAFSSEGATATQPGEPRVPTGPPTEPWTPRAGVGVPWAAWGYAIAIIATVGVLGLVWDYARRFPVAAAVPRPGRLTIETRPAGAEVVIDGQRRGTTPVSLALNSGPHTVALSHGAEQRVLPLTLAAGAEVTQYVEFKVGDTVTALTGGMSIVTDPPGAAVQIDGKSHGKSPLTLTDLQPADYRVRVSGDTGSADRTVTVKPGATASVTFSLPTVSTPSAGWLTVSAPFDVQILEGDSVVGTSAASKTMLPAGRHTLALVNESLKYRTSRTIEVAPGKTATIPIDPPKVSINANARPWADVTIDGKSVGQTPISNLLIAVGTHEVVFRHPQLGERRQTVVVTTQGPDRFAVDLTK